MGLQYSRETLFTVRLDDCYVTISVKRDKRDDRRLGQVIHDTLKELRAVDVERILDLTNADYTVKR